MTERKVVFSSRFMTLLAVPVDGGGEPYYVVDTTDYVGALALTPEGRVLLVRQFRPVFGRKTLEFPFGHVEPGQTPAEAAAAELLEETGYSAEKVVPLGELGPDSGRLGNRMHCFFIPETRAVTPMQSHEAGIEVVALSPADLKAAILSGEMDQAFALSILSLAQVRGLFSLR